MGKEAHLASFILIISGLFVYWFYGRIKSNREYALLHLVERVTAKEITSYSLEAELREIIRERDNIVKDRFDHIIEDCVVLDMEKSVTLKDFFKAAADTLSHRLNAEPAQLAKLLMEREKQSSTVLSPTLAIPHIIVEGNHLFDILLARCKEGIVFSESQQKVHAVFVIIGTTDERHFHLQALSAIAQIVQEPSFEKAWMAAKGKDALKDIVLLGTRRRH